MRIASFAFIVLLGMPVAPVAAVAQDAPWVQLELDRTDRRIAMAERVVAESDNAQARAELHEAIRIQADAKLAMSQARHRVALELTVRARQRADRAIALVNRLPDPDRVLAQIERTQGLIDRGRERIEECNDHRARAWLATAVEMQRRAQEAARGGHYLGALQLTMGSRERVHKALRACRLGEDVGEGAERALRRTDDVIEQARERVAARSVPVARRQLARAIEIQERAWAEFRAERSGNSIRLTLSARAFAFRALRRAGSD